MRNKVITISREFGSGGHFIGEELAKKLGVRYYDKDIIDKVAEETGLSAKFVETQGEYAPTKNFFSYSFIGRDASGASLADQTWGNNKNYTITLNSSKLGFDTCVNILVQL